MNRNYYRLTGAGLLLAAALLLSFAALSATARAPRSRVATPKTSAPKEASQITTPTVAGNPRFFAYMSPAGVGDSAGEPSIGSNWTKETVFTNHNLNGTDNSIPNGGSTLYFGGFLPAMLKVTFNDCSSPAGALWEQKPLLSASTPRAAGDPILFTDQLTGRTFVAQLEGLTPAGATIDITDDDGDTFTPSDGVVPSDVDHETLGGGPYHSPIPPDVNPLYPNAVYYASQSVAEARCLRSDTGGLVFSQGSAPMFTAATCDGLHGHVKVSPATAPDAGTVYVPDKACGNVPLLNGGNAAVAFSEDNGITWTVSEIPDGAAEGEWDPSVGIASDGTIYEGYQDINGHAKIAVGHHNPGSLGAPGTITWSPSVDVGSQLGLNNITFPAVVAGDPDRATFAFFGTTTADCLNCTPVEDHTGGSNNDPTLFTGVWYLFTASTFDGGQTWFTQNITPGDPIQRGPICGGSTCRNLLDFFGSTIDKEGRVLIGYDDGCVTSGCISGGANDYTAKAAIARQSGGRRMYATFDPVEPALPG
ncbi:MAG TPA: sialidase family protein, partial [Chthoniobacterales bacterium]